MMRITTGIAKGRKISVPKGDVRPTKDIVRQAIFSIIGPDIQNKEVLDLFAGSGSLGLEALSRGANHATFVDIASRAVAVISKNINEFGFNTASQVIQSDFLDFLRRKDKQFDIIFADPPYSLEEHEYTLNKMASLLMIDGLIIYETSLDITLDLDSIKHLSLGDMRKYGKSKIYFFVKK